MTIPIVLRELGYVLQRKNSITDGRASVAIEEIQRRIKLLEGVHKQAPNPDQTRLPLGAAGAPVIGKAMTGHPETSQASRKVYRLTEKRRQVLSALASMRGGTDMEVRRWLIRRGYHISECGPRVRRVECCEVGWVWDSGSRKQTDSGGTAIVWELTQAGHNELNGLGGATL